MDRKTRWRTIWLGVGTILALLILVPSFVSSERLPVWFQKTFNRKIQLGLDLQGGLHIVYSIDLSKAVDDKASEIKRDLEDRLTERKVDAKVSTPLTPAGAVTVRFKSAADLKKLTDSKFLSDYDEIIQKRDCPAEEKADQTLCIRVSSDYSDRIKKSALEQAIRTVRDRIDEKGIAEPTVISKGDQIIVELPGLDDKATEQVKSLIARTAKLEFKMVEDGSSYMKKLYAQVEKDKAKAGILGIEGATDLWRHDETGKQFRDWYLTAKDRKEFFTIAQAQARGCYNKNKSVIKGKVECNVSGRSVIENYLVEAAKTDKSLKLDDDHQLAFELVKPEPTDEQKRDPYWRSYYLRRAVELGGTAIKSSNVFWNPTSGRPEVLVNFNRWGGRRFGDMTSKNVGKKMAIILDDKVSSAPVIQAAIRGGSSTISMGGSNPQVIQQEAQDLVNVLRTGSLPAPLKEETSSKVGPLLGRDAIAKTKFSFILGSLLVVFIMIGVYRVSGTIAIGSLILNILYMLAVLALFGATLTLPGIAAVVLTVGMAVDANIIIFERIREELRLGKSIRGAVDAGFSRGFAAILDGQLTTAVAAYVLMQYGSGPIRGFAVMLIIGIACTLFTATWCTRLFFEHYIGRGSKVTKIAI